MRDLKPPYRCIFVKWKDHSAFSSQSWKDIDEVKSLTPVECKTLGWLVKDDKDHIVVVFTISDQDTSTGNICILKKDIIEQRYLDE